MQLNDLINEVLVLVNSSHRSNNIVLTLSLASQLPPLYLDKELIKQAILNLLINAIQAVSDQGKIEISTLMSANQKYQLIRIKDDGEGIKSEIMDKIFTPFFTTKISGTGLGLAMVEKIVSSHKGQISIKNNEHSNGVTVEVALPVN